MKNGHLWLVTIGMTLVVVSLFIKVYSDFISGLGFGSGLTLLAYSTYKRLTPK